ncbi:MAG: sugar ABC transporter substrate-binding protein [Sphingomonas taxi]|uniref:Sugar ABC transporter substrate-binding protein n=1 Tax=Sphingomonas taxi TaxID=1549858 RepID=A0A2W5AJ57_9SPHN|nr:MAG: sugar ABC transporter substrate-binding protein [Sphingomonas taxi]
MADRKPGLDYFVVDLTPDVLGYFPQSAPESLRQGFGINRGAAPTLPLGVGDVVSITLFESSAGGLFIPAEAGSRPGNYITLPNQTIDRTGNVSVPYGGNIRAVGSTAAELQRRIEEALADRAIEPQAVVQIVSSRSNQVSVLGDVNQAAQLEINPAGERILDVIARAEGISTPGVETYITLQRNNRTATVPFEVLVSDPSENIYVYPNDTIYVNRERRTYLAFGASGLNGRIDFQESNLTMAEAVAQAGGLLDSRADPKQVFLYRLVDSDTLARMGLPADRKDNAAFPVIFRANLRDPSTFFLAQTFPMRDRDIIYVSNSDSIEVLKFLNIVNAATSSVSDVAADYSVTRAVIRNTR